MSAAALLLLLAAQDWPQFRGPEGDGLASVERLPLAWAEGAANVKWKAEIPGLGWSSPVVADGKVWLTTATEGGASLRAVCVGLADGKVLRDVEVFKLAEPGRIHKKNSHASPTPIVDGGRVYVHFGPHGTACLEADSGRVVWKRTVPYAPVHGPGGSPALAGGALVFACDGSSGPFVIALDRKTGAPRWKTPRQQNTQPKKFAFCTPLVAGSQVVIPAAGQVEAYDAATGRTLWWASYPGGYSVVPRPVRGHGLVFVSSSFDKPVLMAVREGGKGDVTATHVAWRMDRQAPHSASPLLAGDELYGVSDRGVASCLDAKTGAIHWQERVGGNFSASPILGAGRLYLQDEDGVTTVIRPGKTFERLARNELPGRTLASPAAVEGALLLRTDTHLYRIEAE